MGDRDVSRRTGLILVPLMGLVVLGLAACASGPGTGGSYLTGGTGASCKALAKKMNRIYGQGRGNSTEYRRVLDAYLARGCYRRR